MGEVMYLIIYEDGSLEITERLPNNETFQASRDGYCDIVRMDDGTVFVHNDWQKIERV